MPCELYQQSDRNQAVYHTSNGGPCHRVSKQRGVLRSRVWELRKHTRKKQLTALSAYIPMARRRMFSKLGVERCQGVDKICQKLPKTATVQVSRLKVVSESTREKTHDCFVAFRRFSAVFHFVCHARPRCGRNFRNWVSDARLQLAASGP